MEIIILFFKPYMALSITGGYSFIQVLEALGYVSTSNGINLFDGRVMIIYNVIYFISIFFIFILNIIASFSLSNRLTIFLFLVWMSPGILQINGLIDIMPNITTYSLGMGRIGNIDGILISAFLVTIFSWSISTILLHLFRLGKKFKAFYDHIWYIFGLSAVIFFIYDFDKESYKKDFVNETNKLTKSINILDTQIPIIEENCKSEKFNQKFPSVCNWIKPAKLYIKKLNSEKEYLFLSTNTNPSLDSLLNKSKQSVETLSSEIDKLNDICKKYDSKSCIEVPIELNRGERFLNGEDFGFRKYIIPVKQLMPSIDLLWDKNIELYSKLKEYERLSYQKWLFFMFLAFLIGIKVSNSSREIFKGKEYSVYWFSIKYLFKTMWKIIVGFKKILSCIFNCSYNFLSKINVKKSI